ELGRGLLAFFPSRIGAASIPLAIAFAVIGQFMTMQNLYVFIVNGELILHKTFEKDVLNAISEAGIDIHAADLVDPVSYKPSGGISEVVIRKPWYVTVVADGKSYRRFTMGDSVASMLSHVGVTLGVNDQVTPDLGMPTSDGMTITVTRRNREMRRQTEDIPFETIRKPQKSLNAGEERVVQPGVLGERELLYQAIYRDGLQVGETFVREGVSREPISEIIEYGTGGTVNVDGVNRRYVRALDVVATAYSTEGRERKRTATGTIARVGAIAVDPRVIPLGTRMYIEAPNGRWVYGIAVAEDTGKLIKGNIIDLYFNTVAECIQFGRRKAVVYILE
ncbi:MAG: 3D domain-containing protein, partial [Oscillospiraceae bacterium]|nr:3D domain-containing protein [Oscillospiraceae bacterium]